MQQVGTKQAWLGVVVQEVLNTETPLPVAHSKLSLLQGAHYWTEKGAAGTLAGRVRCVGAGSAK